MSKLVAVFTSQVGKKVLTGLTGLGLFFFVITHLLGNLQLFIGAEVFNLYTHKLESLGPILYVIELGLLAFFVLHAVIGINIYLRKQKARPEKYSVYNSAGKPSKQTLSSRTMMVTGSVLLLFTIVHVVTFKFGPGVNEGYTTLINGIEMRDMHRLVIEKFQQEAYVFGYVAVMILLGFHLRHGVWSAFQSLGASNRKYAPFIYTTGVVMAVLIAVGFLVLPIWIYFTGGVR